MLKKKEIFIYAFFFIFLFLDISYSKIQIKYKIDDQIITNIDIIDEKNYLIFLKPNLAKLSEEEILKISLNSLIKEIIKKKELDRIFQNVDKEKIATEVKKNLFKYKNVKNESEFLGILNNYDIEYSKIVEKIQYEGLWNELIFKKYNSLVKINRNKLRKDLVKKISNDKKFEYELFEILFEIEKDETYKNKIKHISEYINKNDFKSAASKFSISNSANKGGEIGWIKETLLSEELNNILIKLKKGDITQPLKYPNGYLILKLNDKKEMKQIIDIDKELEEIIRFEKNRQLNQFSLLFYKKLKQNSKINEY